MFNRETIFEDDDLVVIHDLNDSNLPIGIGPNVDEVEWLHEPDAILAAKAILTTLGEPVPDVVLASEVSFNEGVVRLAAAHGRTVTFNYAKGDGAIIETRCFKPEEVKTSKEGRKYFLGPDPDREGELRAYRIDRMKGEVRVA